MLENVKIYISEDSDSEAYELYANQKESRGDVLVEYEKELYKFEFSTALSLTQEYEGEKVWIESAYYGFLQLLSRIARKKP